MWESSRAASQSKVPAKLTDQDKNRSAMRPSVAYKIELLRWEGEKSLVFGLLFFLKKMKQDNHHTLDHFGVPEILISR